VVAEHVTMIRAETDDRVVENSLLPECPDEHTDLLIDMNAECIKGTSHFELLLRLSFEPLKAAPCTA
jgi:hypothetical protein